MSYLAIFTSIGKNLNLARTRLSTLGTLGTLGTY